MSLTANTASWVCRDDNGVIVPSSTVDDGHFWVVEGTQSCVLFFVLTAALLAKFEFEQLAKSRQKVDMYLTVVFIMNPRA
jgi:hypothetical protein